MWRLGVCAWGLGLSFLLSEPVLAGAWNQPKGQGQAIVKYEPVWSIHWLDKDGVRYNLPEERVDHVVSLWAEYGVTERLTVLVKTDWQDVGDSQINFQGMGPTEIGGRYRLWSDERMIVSAQASLVSDSDGRNAAWSSAGFGETEAELRLLAGRSFGGRYPSFFEAQLAHRWRDNLPSEMRVEGAAGVHFNDRYMGLFQVYAGKTLPDDKSFEGRWNTYELGVVRHWSDWSAQLGWRSTVAGRNITAGDGPILGIWRRF